MALLIVVLSLPLLFSGVRIINSSTSEFGQEILQAELESLIEPINLRYQTLARVGLEDSQSHRQEIQENAYSTLRRFRYKETGTVFVVRYDRQIILSSDFTDPGTTDFKTFYTALSGASKLIEYQVDGKARIGVAHYYKPWQSYIGLAMDRRELFAPRDLFIKINLLVLLAVVAIAGLFSIIIHHFLITPILRLSRYAEQVSRGDLDSEIPGHYILELATMKRDIRHMVASLVSREDKYRAVFNAPSDAIFVHEAGSGKILEVNQAMTEMYGYSQAEVLGLDIGDLSSGEQGFTVEEAGKRVEKVLNVGPQRFEWHARRKNGQLFWVDVALRSFNFGENLCVLAVVRDIEEQKKAAQELAAEKEQLAITLRSIGDGVITTDGQGRVVLLNRVAEKLTGWRQERAKGNPLSDIFHIVDGKTGGVCPNPALEVLNSGRRVELARDTLLVAKDGSRRNIADSAAPIYNPASEMVGVVLVFRDISEKQRMEQEIIKVKKLESVGVLAGGIAHDFNNLLAAILGNLNLVRLGMEEESKPALLLREAEKASLRAQHLTQQLLTFSKGGEPVRKTSDLGEIIRENVEFVLRGSSIGYELQLQEDLWPVDVDPGQVGQVIQNIILNGRQAMEEATDSQIVIKAHNCQNCTENEVVASSCVHVTISDNGPGIPPAVLEKIFDPYFSTKQEGSGLGLAICHSIIAKHGGVLTAQSELGQGASFTIKLPVASEGEVIMPLASTPKAIQKSLKILVMDDEEMLRTLAAHILIELGHEAEVVEDGDEALAVYIKAMEAGSPFDGVIMDLTIPGGMGGKECVVKLLELDQKARVIVSSGYSNDPVMANYQAHGFVAMLVKPFGVSDLERVLRESF